MRKVYVIARREYLAAVKTKAFIIGLVFMPLLMGGSVLVQKLVEGVRDVRDKHFAVVDRTDGKVRVALEAAVQVYNDNVKDPQTGKQARSRFVLEFEEPGPLQEQRFALSERVRKGQLVGFLDIGPDVLTAEPITYDRRKGDGLELNDRAVVRYHSNKPTFMDFSQLAEKAISAVALTERAKKIKVEPTVIAKAALPVPVLPKGLLQRDAVTGKIRDASEQSRLAGFFVPFIMIMLMFMVIMSGATPLMQGIVEEKMQRIAEVLLGCVSPFQLMLGKLLGMTAVSLTIGAVYLSGAYWAAHHFEWTEYVSPALLVWFLVYQTLAVLMYGALFIAIGAACSDMKETQNLLAPVMILVCLPLFVTVNIIQEPNGPVATGLSFFPFATPMLMIARQAVPPGIEAWQSLVGVLLVLATTALCVWAAGRIFHVGILMQGKGAKLSEIFRWVLRG